MATMGDSTNWNDFFQKDLLPTAILYIIKAWEKMTKPSQSELEDTITDKLYVALRNAKDRNLFPFHISREDLEFDLKTEKVTGRKDIVFYPSLQEQEIYLCIEAKRLNAIISGVCRSLADEYVKEGMLRFVNRKYSRHVRHGLMLAYVLDGDIKRSIKNIESNIQKRLSELRMEKNSDLKTSMICPGDNRIKETRHKRNHEKALFRLHHLFLSSNTGKK